MVAVQLFDMRRSTRPESILSASTSDARVRVHARFYHGTMAKNPLFLILIFRGANSTSSNSPRIPCDVSTPVSVLSAFLQETSHLAVACRGRYCSLFLSLSTLHLIASLFVLRIDTMSLPRTPHFRLTFGLVPLRSS